MKENNMHVLKSVHLLLDKSEELALIEALHLHAVHSQCIPDSQEKRLSDLASYSLLKKVGAQLYVKNE